MQCRRTLATSVHFRTELPVTAGVAGSSPVHSANDAFDDDDLAAFGRLSSFYRSFGIEGTSTHGRRSHQYPAARSTLAGMSPDSR